MAEPADINVDELRRRARRRLVGAVVLALAVAVVVPMLLETEPKPLGDDVSVKIPPVDEGRFVNRLNAKDAGAGAARPEPAPSAPAPERTTKYDTHVPDTDASPAKDAASAPQGAAASTEPAPAKPQAAQGAGAVDAPATAAAEPAKATPAEAPNAAPPEPPKAALAESAKPSAFESAKPALAKPGDVAKAPGAHAAREGFAVQLAAFADDRGANALAGRLKRAGYAAYTEPLKTSKGTLWRVRVGPYPSREAALAARDKLRTEGQSGIVAAIK